MLIALRAVLLVLFIAAPVGGQSPEADLRRLAEAYATDPALTRPVTFGLRIDGADWTVAAMPAAGDAPAKVTVARGAPGVPAFVYVTDAETFDRIAAGELHALAAIAHAPASNATPMHLETVNGHDMCDSARAAFLSVSLAFFTPGHGRATGILAMSGENA